jgi:hypothetical protein
MRIKTVQWQARGNDETLDSRLSTRRGWSKIHLVADPIDVPDDCLSIADFACNLKLECGRTSPDVSESIAERWNQRITCRACIRKNS